MAFYKDVKGKTRKEKQTAAQSRGGFEDEGSRYHSGGSRGKAQPRRFDDRPAGTRGDSQPPRTGGRYGQPARSGEGYGQPPRTGGRYGQPARSGESYGQPPRTGGRYGQPARSGEGYGQRSEQRSTRRPDSDSRPISFRDRPRATPQGERQGMNGGAPRDFRKAGDYRFSTGEPRHYNERGSRETPPSYDERRRSQMTDEPRYDRYRYNGPAAYDVTPEGDQTDVVPNENLLSGRNPIREALKSGRDIEKLLVARGELSGSAREIVQMAKERHIPVQEVERVRLDDITHNHQGMLAFASAYQYSTVERMLALAEERGEAPFLILLDGITDPHNLGAIIRTAECAGAHGVIVEERRAVGLTPAAVKASAGAIEHMPVARVTNLCSTLEALKAKNIWAYAADMTGEDYATVDFKGAAALVIGAEGEGVGRRVLECCDKAVSIPLKGKLESLNASVAAGILMYAVLRSR